MLMHVYFMLRHAIDFLPLICCQAFLIFHHYAAFRFFLSSIFMLIARHCCFRCFLRCHAAALRHADTLFFFRHFRHDFFLTPLFIFH